MFKALRASRAPGPPGFWNQDAATVERIRLAYLRALDAHIPDTSSIWDFIAGKQRDIHDALSRGGESARAALADPTATNLYYGVDNMAADILGGRNLTRGLDEDIRSLLAQLAAMLGARPMPNPQGGQRYPPGAAPGIGIEDALALLDTVLPAPVDFPNPFRGEIIATASTRGFISQRAIHAIYQAYRIRQSASRGAARCLEIGGGTGRTAYYATRFGMPAYTIIDLPMTLVGQACFLMATLGAQRVSLFGEDDGDGSAIVRLRPPHWLFAGREDFDVALNSDALTEMGRDYAVRYIDFIRARCRAFISINHEANEFSVRELWPGLMRFSYVLRPGYVEEFMPAAR